jgi:SnoaL-like protein
MRARVLFVVSICWVSTACSAVTARFNVAKPAKPSVADSIAIVQLADEMMQAVASSNGARWFQTYDSLAVRIGEDRIYRGAAEIRSSIDSVASGGAGAGGGAKQSSKPKISITLEKPTVTMIGRNYAIYYAPFASSMSGDISQTRGVITLVMARQGKIWRILHEHSSVE